MYPVMNEGKAAYLVPFLSDVRTSDSASSLAHSNCLFSYGSELLNVSDDLGGLRRARGTMALAPPTRSATQRKRHAIIFISMMYVLLNQPSIVVNQQNR